MNRFIIEFNVGDIAESLCDQHIVKMPLDEAQMLCTALWHHDPEYAEQEGLYKPVHQKHPCTLWAMQTRANYIFAYKLYSAMLQEYTHRYGKFHGACKHQISLFQGRLRIPEGWQTPHPQCFSGLDHLKTDEQYPIKAYREFYKADKLKFARYTKGRSMPEWMAA